MTSDGDASVMELPVWPGLHPGTGYNDHPHSWQAYRAQMIGGGWVRIDACTVCGTRRT